MVRLLSWLLGLFAGLLTVSLAGAFAIVGGARFLEEGEPIEPADLIVVFAGDYPYRAAHAADLFRRGYGRDVVATGGLVADELCVVGMPLTGAQLSARVLRKRGVPAAHIHVLSEGRNTAGEALAIRRFAADRHVRRVIAVTSPYHVRRALWILREAFADTTIDVRGSAAPTPAGRQWWRTKGGFLHLTNELLKIAYHLLPAPVRSRTLLSPPPQPGTNAPCPAV